VRFLNDSAFIGRELGLNRREHRLCSRRASERLEPDEAKVSRPVLRGGSGSNAALLPDLHRLMVGPVPVTTMPVSFRKKRARHEQHPHNTKCLACFRLRHGDGRFAPAPFLPSLRLRFTFPFAEPQAEATRGKGSPSFSTCAYLNNNLGGLKI